MPLYNAFESTRPRRSRRQSDSANAGAAKVPRVGVNKSDLEAQGEQFGWTARPLTYNEVREMSSAELRWHEAFNKENLEHAFTLAENQRVNKERMPTWNVRRMWGGGATADEDSAARIAGNQFATRCPQFERSIENAQKIVEWMQAHDLDATKVESYVTAFQALVEDGKLSLAKPESADAFLANHPELQDRRTPPLIQARTAKAQATAEHFERAQAATARSGATTVVTYEDEQSGYPAAPTKYSFRKLLDSLSAQDFQKRLNGDPQFAAAVDKLQNGNT